MRIIDSVVVFGDPIDEGAFTQILNCKKDANYVALMADHHKGYNMPIGGVAAYEDHISPSGVGFDIACGNRAIKLDLFYSQISADLPALADKIFSSLSFGVGLSNKKKIDHLIFDSFFWNDIDIFNKDTSLISLARDQLGTIGSGNHYVNVFKDENEQIWVGVHFGSRGLGHKIATEFIKLADGNPNGNMDDPPVLIEARSDLGEQYIRAMEFAGLYADIGREWVCKEVARILGNPKILDTVTNHHNFACSEQHYGSVYWVVRKGATPSFPGKRSFVGGSMGDSSVIIESLDSQEARASLYSTIHGAGRVMSRTEAAGKQKWVNGKPVRISNGKVNMNSVLEDLKSKNIILKGGGPDEAPEVYKRLPEVLKHHNTCVKVIHTLDPVIVCMAGSNEYDPYKD